MLIAVGTNMYPRQSTDLLWYVEMIVKYILCGVIALILLYLATLLICALLVDTGKTYSSPSRLYRMLLNSATWVALKITRVHVHVTGMEKLPGGRKILFVGNHISNFDPIVTWAAFKQWNISYLSKQENFKIPMFGRIIRRCCFMPIDRENPRKAIGTINQAAQLLQSQIVSIGVYPEGTRSRSGELLPFHDGVFKIAKKAGAPIGVIAVSGTNRIAKNFPFHKTDVYLDVLEVIPAEDVKDASTHILGAEAAQMLIKNAENREKTWQQDIY